MIECKDSCGDDSSRYRLKISEDEVFFGTILVGNASPAFEITLENVGWEDILFQSLSITGPFTLVRTNCPDVLKPGQKGRIAVTFTPTAFGPWTGAVFIMAGRAGDHNIRLVGAGYNSNENGDDLSGIPIFLTRENLEDNTNLVYANGTYALVISDEVLANNDFYQKTGDSGEGDWGEPLGKLSTIILNGQIDLKNLDDVIHGAADLANPGHPAGTVTLRNGETYRTLANILALQIAEEEIAIAAAATATTQAGITTTQAGIATAQASIATTKATAAAAALTDILALNGVKGMFDTKAAANAGLAGLANGTLVLVKSDETHAGASWHYLVTAGAYVDKGAAVNAGRLTVPGGTLSGAGAVTTIPIEFQTPTGAQTNSGGGDDAVNWQFVRTTGKFTQGPTGFTNYHDNVLSIAANVNGNLTTRTNAAMPIFRIAMESKYAQGGATDAFLVEWHLVSLWPLNAAIGEYRGISAVVPHDHTKWEGESSLYFRGGVIAFAAGGNAANSYAGSDIYAQIDVRSATARFVDFSGTSNGVNFRLRFNKNANAIIQQLNAAGNAVLNLPYIDQNDALNMGGGGTIVCNGVASTSTITALKGMLTMNASGMAAGGHMAYLVSSTAVTGNMSASYFQYNATGYGEHTTINTASGGASGYRTRTTAGKMFLEFHDNTGNRHIGFTYYPTGNGKLSLDDAQQGGQYATKTAFEVDYASFQVRFVAKPPIIPAHTVAVLATITPTLGAIAVASNGRKAGEGSGVGTGVQCWADGSAWRTNHDNSIVAA